MEKIHLLNEDIFLCHVKEFLTREECLLLIEWGKTSGQMQPSTLVYQNQNIVSPYRNSTTAFVPPSFSLYSSIMAKAALLAQCPVSRIEGLKLLHYDPQQQYGPHHDYFTAANPAFIEKSGDREKTILVYLNTVPKEDGGATHFPHLNISVSPVQGDAVYWKNMDSRTGEYYEKTLHAGEMLLKGEKWALNIWVREKSCF
jgi:prolyl 4-hydroxylase